MSARHPAFRPTPARRQIALLLAVIVLLQSGMAALGASATRTVADGELVTLCTWQGLRAVRLPPAEESSAPVLPGDGGDVCPIVSLANVLGGAVTPPPLALATAEAVAPPAPVVTPLAPGLRSAPVSIRGPPRPA